MIYQTVS